MDKRHLLILDLDESLVHATNVPYRMLQTSRCLRTYFIFGPGLASFSIGRCGVALPRKLR